MNASKENARAAYKNLDNLKLEPSLAETGRKTLAFVKDFLVAAERKLPTEAAFERAQKQTALKRGANDTD